MGLGLLSFTESCFFFFCQNLLELNRKSLCCLFIFFPSPCFCFCNHRSTVFLLRPKQLDSFFQSTEWLFGNFFVAWIHVNALTSFKFWKWKRVSHPSRFSALKNFPFIQAENISSSLPQENYSQMYINKKINETWWGNHYKFTTNNLHLL